MIADQSTTQFWSQSLERFGTNYGLSTRERELLRVLISEVTQSEDIALQLSISTHTVNNHLKNIFEKTKTKSKTDLLAKFYGFATQNLISSQRQFTLQRSLQILFLTMNPSQGAEVVEELQRLGANAVWSTTLNRDVTPSLLEVDWVVKPLEFLRDMDVDELVSLRRSHNLCIQLNKKANNNLNDIKQNPLAPELFALGCVGVLELDRPASELAFDIARMIQDFSSYSGGLGVTSVEKQVNPTHQLGPIVMNTEFIGSHGFCLNLSDIGKNKLSWQVGDTVSFALSLPEIFEMPINLQAQVVWKRLGNDLGRLPGMGFWIQNFATIEDRRRYVQAAFECHVLWAIPPATDQFELANDRRKQLRLPAGA